MLVYYFVPFIVSNRYLLFWVSNGHNSVTVQNQTHVSMNFFDHKDLGNHLLQLCPKVVKHPVYTVKQANTTKLLHLYTHIFLTMFIIRSLFNHNLSIAFRLYSFVYESQHAVSMLCLCSFQLEEEVVEFHRILVDLMSLQTTSNAVLSARLYSIRKCDRRTGGTQGLSWYNLESLNYVRWQIVKNETFVLR